eukprot:scaffold3571_cov176-Amphora_coffeaeformis.AAC.24
MLVRNHIKLQTCTTAAAAPALPPPRARLELFLRIPCQSMAGVVDDDDDGGATAALSAAVAGSPPSAKMTPALTMVATKKARREEKESSVITSPSSSTSSCRICRVVFDWTHDMAVAGSVSAPGGAVAMVDVCRTTRSTFWEGARAATGISTSNQTATAITIIGRFIIFSTKSCEGC